MANDISINGIRWKSDFQNFKSNFVKKIFLLKSNQLLVNNDYIIIWMKNLIQITLSYFGKKNRYEGKSRFLTSYNYKNCHFHKFSIKFLLDSQLRSRRKVIRSTEVCPHQYF